MARWTRLDQIILAGLKYGLKTGPMSTGGNDLPVDPVISVKLARVFVSYSRADAVFADELVDGLEWAGFEPRIDRESIVEGEDWRARLGALIAEADTVVFVLSRASASSKVCAWELDEAHRLSKRLLPVLVEPTGDVPLPERLAALNYVRFDPYDDGRPRSFMAGLRALVRALKTDLAWLREHTRLLARAIDWDSDGRPRTRLLRGSDIVAAKVWASSRPRDAPETTQLHHAFIEASELAESERKSEERQRLNEIAAAQTERTQALDERERAVKSLARRTFLGIAGTSVAATGAGVASYRTFIAEKQSATATELLRDSKRQVENWKRLIAEDSTSDQRAFVGGRIETVKSEVRPESARKDVNPSWAIRAVGADRSPSDGSEVVMAHLGMGLDTNHPAFAGIEMIQRDFSGEGNGDAHGHGTHIASLAFGRNTDGRRIGVARGVERVLVAKVAGTLNAIVPALDWIAGYKGGIVDVVFMGLGFRYPSMLKHLRQQGLPPEAATASVLKQFLQAIRAIESISLAAQARGKGMTFIASGGNGSAGPENRLPVTTPTAVARGSISVGAIQRGNNGYEVARFSESEVTLCAPGVDTPVAKLGGGLTTQTGSSMAAAVAAGTAALWWSFLRQRKSRITAEDVWKEMKASVRTDVFAPGVKEEERGLGLIQAPGP